MTFEEAFIAARNARGDNKDFAHDQGEVLAPGEALKISSSIGVDTRGDWTFFPCYTLPTGVQCPDEWRAFQVSVRE